MFHMSSQTLETRMKRARARFESIQKAEAALHMIRLRLQAKAANSDTRLGMHGISMVTPGLTQTNLPLTDMGIIYQETPLGKKKILLYGSLWTISSVLLAIATIYALVQPDWRLGSEIDFGTSYYGLWMLCQQYRIAGAYVCHDYSGDHFSTNRLHFEISVLLAELVAVLSIVWVVLLPIFLIIESYRAFRLFAWLQFISAITLILAVIVFPVALYSHLENEICEPDSDGAGNSKCGIIWAYTMAIIGVFWILISSAGSFLLSNQTKPATYVHSDCSNNMTTVL